MRPSSEGCPYREEVNMSNPLGVCQPIKETPAVSMQLLVDSEEQEAGTKER